VEESEISGRKAVDEEQQEEMGRQRKKGINSERSMHVFRPT
jgi:hypothetical protein